jgi:hypothetical protein
LEISSFPKWCSWMSKICGGVGREANQVLISFCFGELTLKPLTLRDVATHFGISVRMKLTLPKVGSWSPPGLSKTQSSIVRVKTLRIRVFIISLEKVLKCRCPKGPHMGHLC